MVWKTLAESLESALASIANEVGDEAAGTRLDAVKLAKSRGKGPDAETPGQVTELRQREEKPDGASRERMNAALPIGRKQRIAPGSPIPVVAGPMPAVRCFLVIEGGLGGRPAQGGGVKPGGLARAAGGGRTVASNSLRLVV